MNIAIVTDAWRPQVNGVVTTLSRTREGLEARGHKVTVVNPGDYRSFPCPTYPEIRLAVWPGRRLVSTLDGARLDAIHIATEGPLGSAARRWCLRSGLNFTTSYHTQFPQYLRKRLPVPEGWSYAWLRRFHGRAARTLVPTEHVRRELVARGFENVVIWSRGVDTSLFRPLDRDGLERDGLTLPRPIGYMHREANASLPRLLDRIGFQRGILVGHSDGASIATIYAGSHQDHRVRGLVLMAPHFIVEDISVKSIAEAREAYNTGDLRARLAKYHPDVDVAFRGWNDVWLDPAFKRWNLEGYLPRVTCPTVLIQGELDEYGTLEQIDAIERQLGGRKTRLVLKDCGHSPHRDRPEAVLEAIARLAAEVDPTA